MEKLEKNDINIYIKALYSIKAFIC